MPLPLMYCMQAACARLPRLACTHIPHRASYHRCDHACVFTMRTPRFSRCVPNPKPGGLDPSHGRTTVNNGTPRPHSGNWTHESGKFGIGRQAFTSLGLQQPARSSTACFNNNPWRNFPEPGKPGFNNNLWLNPRPWRHHEGFSQQQGGESDSPPRHIPPQYSEKFCLPTASHMRSIKMERSLHLNFTHFTSTSLPLHFHFTSLHFTSHTPKRTHEAREAQKNAP